MAIPKQSRTRAQIRQSIGYNLGVLICSNATAEGSTTTLIDTVGLLKGVTDEYKRSQVYITSTVTNGAAVGQTAIVSAFDATTRTLTFAPAMDKLVKATQGYELWRDYLLTDINDFIQQALTAATSSIYIEKTDATLTTAAATCAYAIPSGFTGIYLVEYLPSAVQNYVPLAPDHWRLDRPNGKLVITDTTLAITGAGKTLRLTGYRVPALPALDTEAAEIDPEYIIAGATARALLAGAPSGELDTQNRIAKAGQWRQVAADKLREIRTPVAPGTRWV
jgi:hypothetical protein